MKVARPLSPCVKNYFVVRGRGSMGVGSGGRGLPWIFIHGTSIVDKGFKSAIFRSFLLFFGPFSVAPSASLEIFLPMPLRVS